MSVQLRELPITWRNYESLAIQSSLMQEVGIWVLWQGLALNYSLYWLGEKKIFFQKDPGQVHRDQERSAEEGK